MRLSDIKGERAIDVLADILEPIANIAQDEKAKIAFRNVPDTNENNEIVDHWKSVIPNLIKSHKQDLIKILSALDGIDKEEYVSKMTLFSLFTDCIELLSDEIVVELFTSAQTEEVSQSSGTVQDNIKELI